MCTFPAAKLLRIRREISEAKGVEVKHAAAIVDAIDNARWDHEESGCNCWYDALAAAPSKLNPGRAA